MPLDDETRLRHMLDAAREAIEFVAGKTQDDIDNDKQLALALTKLVEIVGEAASQISQAKRHDHPHIKWDTIIGMRQRLVHGYYKIDYGLLWETIQRDLPILIDQIDDIIGPTTTLTNSPSSW